MTVCDSESVAVVVQRAAEKLQVSRRAIGVQHQVGRRSGAVLTSVRSPQIQVQVITQTVVQVKIKRIPRTLLLVIWNDNKLQAAIFNGSVAAAWT